MLYLFINLNLILTIFYLSIAQLQKFTKEKIEFYIVKLQYLYPESNSSKKLTLKYIYFYLIEINKEKNKINRIKKIIKILPLDPKKKEMKKVMETKKEKKKKKEKDKQIDKENDKQTMKLLFEKHNCVILYICLNL